MWDEDVHEFMVTQFKDGDTQWHEDVHAAYELINPAYGAAKADLFRYCLIYTYGGVWLDIKSTAVNLDNLIHPNDGLLLSYWDPNTFQKHLSKIFCGIIYNQCKHGHGELQQWWMASAPGHPLVRRVIDQVVENIHSHRNTASVAASEEEKCEIMNKIMPPKAYQAILSNVLRVTGPWAFTHAIEGNMTRYPDYRIIDDDFTRCHFEYDFQNKHNPGSYLTKCSPLITPSA